MTVQAGIEAELPFLRAEAEATFTDTFTAYAPAPNNPTTDADGYEVPGWSVKGSTVGKVSGRSRDSDTNTRLVSVGGVERPVVEGGLHIPLSSFLDPDPKAVPRLRLRAGWELVCTAVGPKTDPACAGKRWRVVDVPVKSNPTARRLDVVEVP